MVDASNKTLVNAKEPIWRSVCHEDTCSNQFNENDASKKKWEATFRSSMHFKKLVYNEGNDTSQLQLQQIAFLQNMCNSAICHWMVGKASSPNILTRDAKCIQVSYNGPQGTLFLDQGLPSIDDQTGRN